MSGSNSYTGGTNVNAGNLVLASANAFPTGTALKVVTSKATVNASTGTIFVPQISSLNNSGSIDITNNGLVIQSGGVAGVNTQIQTGFNGGTWNGSSSMAGVITSSSAANDPAHLTAVGVASGLTSFEGLTSLPAADTEIKYTYYGDTNLDGKVDGSDYSRIDSAFVSGGTGWFNGDFNYDGVINGSDYTLIDNAFNTQGAQISSEIASPTSQIAGGIPAAAVPEPTSLAFLSVGIVGVLGRRRRK